VEVRRFVTYLENQQRKTNDLNKTMRNVSAKIVFIGKHASS